MIMQTIHFQSSLTKDEVMKIAREREPEFKALTGLIQKYYLVGEKPGHFGGIYVWDSTESMAAYRNSELAASIPSAYKIIGQPMVSIHEIEFQLRD